MTCCLVLFYISTKYHQNIPKGIWVTEWTQNLFQTKQREITPKVSKPDLSFLYATCCLILFYISTRYHQNTAKGIWLTERTQNQCIITVKYNKGIQRKNQERQNLILFYISTKYHQNIPKGIWVTEQTRNLFQTKQREITPKASKPELLFLYVTRRPVLHFY